MAKPERPQLYIITPPDIEMSQFPDLLGRVLESQDIACVRLSLASQDERHVAQAADTIREICHARDVALVIENHVLMVERLGLDGVHLTDGSKSVRSLRKDLGADAIIGAYCGASSHDGMSAGEAGADYVSFGPVGETPLGNNTQAERDLFQWWSEVIEVPVVAEGALTLENTKTLAPFTDFFALGAEIWDSEDPVKSLGQFVDAMS